MGRVVDGMKLILRRLRALKRDESGVVMLETVLVFPIQLLLMMTLIQFVHLYVADHVVQYASYQAARTYVLNVRGAHNVAEARLDAYRTAWVICSTLDNPGGHGNKLRVPGNRYQYPSPQGSRTPVAIRFVVAAPKGGSNSPGVYSRPETVVAVDVSRVLDLDVPVGGPFLWQCLKSSGKRPVSVNSETKEGQVTITQRSRIPKPWPH